jgi:Fur family transcriptional regulator, stress-responsive regulator
MFHLAAEERLRTASLRVTAQRTSVLEVLARYPHSDVKSLKALVGGRIGSVSTQAMYDVLAALVRAGLVRKIGPAGSPALFELNDLGNHHHMVCRICGAFKDVDCVRGEAPCLTPSVTHGFIVDEADVTFWGTCTSCAETAVGGVEAPSTN